MRFAIAYSKKDPAGINIVNELKKNFLPQVLFLDTKKEIIHFNELNYKNYPILKNIDFLIFASKHQSKKDFPSLTIHTPGNWRNVDYGGKSGKISSTSAFVLKYLFQNLNKNSELAKSKNKLNEKYNVTLEVTHHGPLIDIPCCFIEIGSNQNEWHDEQAGKVIADTILSLQEYDKNKIDWIPCIGIGGPHYCPNFNKIQLNSEYAISHIIPEYCLPLNQTMLKESEEKTKEQIKFVLLDWKGLGNSEFRQKTINLIEDFGLKNKRTKSIKK